MLITQREYARRSGKSHTAVQKAIRTGKIKLVDGKIDAEQADTAWANNRSKVSSAAPNRKRGTAEHRPPASISVSAPSFRGPTLLDAQIKKTLAQAEKATLEAALLKGIVIRTEAVSQEWDRRITPAKTRLLGIGSKLGPQLAMESDAAACQSLVDEAISEALAEISAIQ